MNETLQSVLNQTYQDFEIMVVNDGSIDNTEGVVRELMKKDTRIQLINKQNTGVSDTRNVGIKKANGDFVAFLDADDVWLRDNLIKKIKILEKYPDIGWVYSNMNEIDENSKFIKNAPKGKGDNILNEILMWRGEVIPGPCSNIIVRKEVLDKGIRFDTKFSTAADQDFTLQLAKAAKSYFIDDYLWNYRILQKSMSRNVTVMEKDHIGVYNKASENNLFERFWFKQKCFSNLYLILAGSWWVNGNNKLRGLFFVLKAFTTYPPLVIKKIIAKAFNFATK